MQFPARSLRYSFSLLIVVALAGQLLAAPASDTILPKTTKGFVSVAKPSDFEERWNKTQFGKLLDDELMQPFVKDLRKQLEDEYQSFEDKLGIEWDSLDGVSAGEMSLSLIERQGEDAAIAITIDVTGHEAQSQALLASIEKNFAARGGKKQSSEREGAAWHVFTVPGEAGSPPQTTVYFTRDNLLCGIDDPAEAEAMLKRIAQAGKDNLASVPAYQAVMKKLQAKAGSTAPEARWFVEPFGFLFAARTLEKETARRPELDYIKIFSEQGFDAIKGAGGFLNQLPADGVELVHRIAVYAPPVAGKEKDPLRWNLAMRMLQTPNVPEFEPQSWVPRMSASYTTVHINMMDAFDNVGPLVNALEDHDDAWENSLKGWKEDAYGPKVDVREEFIANLGNRITVVTGYDVPISADSERAIFAIEAKNEKALAETLAKWMSREPGVEKRELGQYVVWERVTGKEALEETKIDVPLGFESLSDPDDAAVEEEADRERVLPNSAVTVALGQLMMASDIKYLEEILAGFGQSERLASSADYQQVMTYLDQQMPGERTALHFGRSDEEFRPTYELIRQGKMPEAKTMFGKMLNKALTTEKEREDGILRQQQIDGSTLPSFEAVRRYFGPHGRATQAEPDGWFVTEVLLNKEAP